MGQLGSDWIFHLQRLTGVERQSIPARIMNDICPAGRENMIWDHTRVSFSTQTMSRSFDWTERIQGENSSGWCAA